MDISQLNKTLGNLDIYLLDQILKGRFEGRQRLLDAGCGEGRNLHWFIREGFDVYGLDASEDAIRMLHYIARSLRKDYDTHRFFTDTIEDAILTEGFFDAVICSAVLHFARDHAHFEAMMEKLCHTLRPGGLLFIRMCSDIGLQSRTLINAAGIAALPDGSTRYLLTRKKYEALLHKHQLQPLEPLKSVNVQDLRVMSTLVLEKKES